MKFLDDNFMLRNEYGKKLYFDYAKDQPIFDFHCHLEAKEIYENKKFKNITQAWLGGDHYKWRVMRAYGIEEKRITGNASDYEKFEAWAKVVPNLIGNPLYHWTHLELKNFFGIEETLSPKTCKEIWEKCNELLQRDDFSPRALISKSNVWGVCTTNDPLDDLKYHKLLKESDFETKVIPAFRPDKALKIEDASFKNYIDELSKVSNLEIKDIDSLKSALLFRIQYFDQNGACASDHGLSRVPFARLNKEELNKVFQKALQGQKLTDMEIEAYMTELMLFLSEEYYKRNWTMELHIQAIRNNNEKMFEKLGPDTGYDAVHDEKIAEKISKLLSAMNDRGLPKTLLFSLNPKDLYSLSTIGGSFQGEKEGEMKVQIGTAWWFLDHKDGMINQMRTLASTSVFSKFVGMLTDSRSFLSYPRHEYFRRIMCNLVGEYVELGEYPWDEEFLGQMVKDISFKNSKDFIIK